MIAESQPLPENAFATNTVIVIDYPLLEQVSDFRVAVMQHSAARALLDTAGLAAMVFVLAYVLFGVGG